MSVTCARVDVCVTCLGHEKESGNPWQTPRIDPFTYSAGAVVLLAVVLLASYVPARRAIHVDPVVALKAE